ncbi:unnamed protein product [Microthlaspi erraticum]|uniref:Uncharacterized protein n=1 Tax=Microthlaspi erraticum TaxID=1685480 RepID=A0A6D2JP68_9BRAS|nr:unnamed protein product [Microthlaspi erraticum]
MVWALSSCIQLFRGSNPMENPTIPSRAPTEGMLNPLWPSGFEPWSVLGLTSLKYTGIRPLDQREEISVVKKKNFGKEKKDSAYVAAEIEDKRGAKVNGNLKKCVCIAYETLRASDKELFKYRSDSKVEIGVSSHNLEEGDEVEVGESYEIGVFSMKR